jgi:hypothetical protein
MPNEDGPKDIITELSGMDSRHRISSKYAARELIHSGQFLFNIVLDKALNKPLPNQSFHSGSGHVRSGSGQASDNNNELLRIRCAEACARAAEENPALAGKRSKSIISFILKNPEGDLRYFFASMLRFVKIPKIQSSKCAGMLEKWIDEETGKSPRACYLEAISALAEGNPALVPLASRLLEKALNSPVASFSARARQIVMRLKKKEKKV